MPADPVPNVHNALTVRLPPELRARLARVEAQGYDLDHVVARALEQLLDRLDESRREKDDLALVPLDKHNGKRYLVGVRNDMSNDGYTPIDPGTVKYMPTEVLEARLVGATESEARLIGWELADRRTKTPGTPEYLAAQAAAAEKQAWLRRQSRQMRRYDQ